MADAPQAVPEETPVFFEADGASLLGILTRPVAEPTGIGVLLASGGGTPSTSTGRNRVLARLARTLAEQGNHVFRFDYHGVGDSTGEILGFRPERPFVADVMAAVGQLRVDGVRRLVIVGSCFGARTAMAAHGRIHDISGMVLLAPPLRDFALSERKTEGWRTIDYLVAVVSPQRILGGDGRISVRRYLRFLRSGMRVGARKIRNGLRRRPRKLAWVSQPFIGGLASLVDRQIPVLIVYGTEDDSYPDFEEAQQADVGELLKRGRDRIEVAVVPGPIHGFLRVDAQARIVQMVSDWVGQSAALSGVRH